MWFIVDGNETDNPQQPMYAQTALRKLSCNGLTFGVNFMPMVLFRHVH